jgi:hypothetical protein
MIFRKRVAATGDAQANEIKTTNLGNNMKLQIKTKVIALLMAALAVVTVASIHQPMAAFASGGSGGGSGGGGGGSVPPTAVAPAITAFKVASGYGPYGGVDGDLQATYGVNMGTSGLAPVVRVQIKDLATGALWWNSTTTGVQGTAGYRYLPLNKTFLVSVELLGTNGQVLDSRSQTASTPATRRIGST